MTHSSQRYIRLWFFQVLGVFWILSAAGSLIAGNTLSQPAFFAFRHCQLIQTAPVQRLKGLYDPAIQLDIKKFLLKIGLIPNLHPKEKDLSKLMREHPPKLKNNTARQNLLPPPGQKLWAFGYAPALDEIKFLGVTKPTGYQAYYDGADGEYGIDFKIDTKPLRKVTSKFSRDTAAEVLEWVLFVSVPPNTAAKDQPQASEEDPSGMDFTVDKIHSSFLAKLKNPKPKDDCPVIARQVIRVLGFRYLVLVMGCKGGPTYQIYKLGKNINSLSYTDSMKLD